MTASTPSTAPCALPDVGEIERVAHGLGELANTFSYFEHERRAFAEWEKICRNTAAKLKERDDHIGMLRHEAEQWRKNSLNAAARIASLFEAIKHGDDEHRAWLQEAITAHFAGKLVPAPRGSGNKEARIAELERALKEMLDIAEVWASVTDRKYVQPENSETVQRAKATLGAHP